MSDFTQTRSEYLKIMMGDRDKALAPYRPERINDLGDTSFDAASLSDADIDNAINMMSGTQYENSDVFKAFQDEKANRNGKSESDRPKSWLENVGDFFSNIGTSITEGIFNVVDDIWDFGVGVTAGLFGGGWFGAKNDFTDWAAEAMTDDRWLAYATKGATQFDVFDKGFWTNEGGYWTDWSYENVQKEQARDYEGMEWLHKGGNFIGEMIPSLLLTYFTGGANLGVTAAAQGGLSFARGMGEAQSRALSEGASFQESAAYGATKGAISGAITATMIGIGGSALGKEGGVGGKVGDFFGDIAKKTGSKGAEIFATKAGEALTHAGFAAASGFTQAMADPFVKQVTYDSDAIANAFGDSEKVKETLTRAGYAALCSAAMSLATSAIREGGSRIIKGQDRYRADFYTQKASRAQSRLENELKSLNNDIQAGKEVDIDARMNEIQRLTSEVENYGKSAYEYWDKVDASNPSDSTKESNSYKREVANFGNLVKRKQLTDLIIKNTNVKGEKPVISYNADGSGEAFIGNVAVVYPANSKSAFYSNVEEPNLPEVEAIQVEDSAILIPATADQMKTVASISRDAANRASIPTNVVLPLKDSKVVINIAELSKAEQVKRLALLESKDFKEVKNGAIVADLGDGKSLFVTADKKFAEIIDTAKTDTFDPYEASDFAKNNNLEWYTERELESTLDNKTVKGAVLFSTNEILDYITKSAEGDASLPSKVRVGKLSPSIVENIKDKTSLDLNGWSLAFTKSDAKHFFDRHVLNGASQKAMKMEAILSIPKIMETASNIDITKKGDGSSTLKFYGPTGELLLTIVSKAGKTVNVKTLYWNEKTLAPNPLNAQREAAPEVPSETRMATKADTNVTLKNENVKSASKESEIVHTNATPSEVKQMAEGKEGKVYSLASVNSTIDAIKDSIQGLLSLDNLGGETKLNLPKNATARDVFNALNLGNDEQKVAAKANLKNQLLNMDVNYKLKDFYGDELESYSGTWKDFLATMSKEEIAKFDSDFDEFFDELMASGDDSKVSKLISAYGNKISEMANAHSELKAQTKLHGHIEKHKVKILDRYYHNDGADFGPGFDFDTKGFKVLLEPLHELQETSGKQSYTGSSAHEGLVKFLDNYKLGNFSKTTIDDGNEMVEVSSIYNQGLRDLASTLLTSIEDNSYTDKNGKVIYRALNSNQLSMLRAFQDEVEQMPKRAATEAVEAVSSAKAAYYGIERYISKFLKNGEIGIVRKFIQEYSDRYANQLDDIRYRLGDNALTKAIYDELYLSASQARGMEDDFQGKINAVREEEGVSNKKLNSLSGFKDTNGKSIENRYLVRVYQNLMAGVDSNNVKYLEANTVYIKDSKNRIKHVAKFSYADKEAIENDLKKAGFLEYTKGLHKIENKDLGDIYESDSVRDSHLPNSNRLEDYTAIELESNQSELGKAYIKSGVVSNGHQRDRVTNIPKGVHLVIRDAETAIMKQVHNQANIHFNNPVLKKINAMLNTKIDNDGKTVKEYLTQNNRGAVELINRAVNGAYGINNNKQHKLIDFVGNGYVMSLIGLNPSSILKQPLSIFWSNDISMASVLKFSIGANLNPVVWKNTSRLIDEIEKEFPELKLRGKRNEALMGNTSSDNIGKVQKAIGKVAGAGLKMADAWTVGHEAIGVLSLQGQQLGYGDVGTAENDAYVKTHYRAFLATQVSSNGLTMSGARAGYYGGMGKFTSFMTGAVQGQIGHLLRAAQQISEFAGKDQQFYDSLIERTKADEESAKKAYEEAKAALEQAMDDYDNDLAGKDDVKEAKANLKDAFDKFTKASGERTDAEESAKAFRHFKDMGGAKGIILSRIAGALLTGISLVAINELASRFKGQKKWDEFDAGSAGSDLAINTLGGWLPVARDLVNAWKGYDLEIPEYAMMKQAYTLVTAISNAAQNPSDKTAKALMRQAIESASAFLGIPTTNLWKYANGIIKTFSPSTAIEMNNLLYGASPTTLAKNAKEYAEKNDISTSADLYQSLYSLSKTGEISREVAVEESKLVAEGFNPIARNTPDYVQGDNNERVVLTDDQRSDFSKVYFEANKQVEKLIKSAKYKNATSEVKAKEIKKVYDLYYEVARYKSLGTDPDSKMGKLLAYASSYDDDVIATIMLIQQNSQLVDNARSTKKEQAIKLVNQQTMSKMQKLLTLYLMGYGVSEDNKKAIRDYLTSIGFTKKQADDFLPSK